MRRAFIAAAWIAGTTVPLLMSVVFVFGCCVLPFHAVVHRVLPLCHVATGIMRGGHGDREKQPPVPAREKQEPVKRLATEVPRSFRLAAFTAAAPRIAPRDATAYRSFIALGALRCDHDVGLHLLVASLLI